MARAYEPYIGGNKRQILQTMGKIIERLNAKLIYDSSIETINHCRQLIEAVNNDNKNSVIQHAVAIRQYLHNESNPQYRIEGTNGIVRNDIALLDLSLRRWGIHLEKINPSSPHSSSSLRK